MYYAKTGLDISMDNYKRFCASWVYKEGHCYISHVDDVKDTFVVAMNFLNSDKIILQNCMKIEMKLILLLPEGFWDINILPSL